MVEVAEEFVEAVVCRQMLVAVAQVILAELTGCVSLGLHDVGDGRHPVLNAVWVAGHADRQQPRAKRFLAENEGSAPCGAALLPIGIGEDRTLGGNTIDVRCTITHQAHGVGADLWNAYVVAEDDEDVRRLAGACRRLLLSLRAAHGPVRRSRRCKGRTSQKEAPTIYGDGFLRIVALFSMWKAHASLLD